jgi:hypothetical protein
VRCIVRVGDREVKLSPKEYELLRPFCSTCRKSADERFLLGELWNAVRDHNILVYMSGNSDTRSRRILNDTLYSDGDGDRVPSSSARLRNDLILHLSILPNCSRFGNVQTQHSPWKSEIFFYSQTL